jgi:ribose 1,5-bisphosphokinase PhnN
MLARAAEVHPALVGNTELVPRCSTREPRQGDVADGLTSITWNEFHAHRAAGTFAMSWERPLKNGSSIGYGCLMPSGNGAPVFVAGHGIYNNKETLQPPTALERALIVGIVAPAEVRAERLRLRSPDVIARGMATTEALLAHDDDAMAANVDMLVRNYGANEAIAIDDFVYALALVLDAAGYKLPSAT